jgi:hypothetical protein
VSPSTTLTAIRLSRTRGAVDVVVVGVAGGVFVVDVAVVAA